MPFGSDLTLTKAPVSLTHPFMYGTLTPVGVRKYDVQLQVGSSLLGPNTDQRNSTIPAGIRTFSSVDI